MCLCAIILVCSPSSSSRSANLHTKKLMDLCVCSPLANWCCCCCCCAFLHNDTHRLRSDANCRQIYSLPFGEERGYSSVPFVCQGKGCCSCLMMMKHPAREKVSTAIIRVRKIARKRDNWNLISLSLGALALLVLFLPRKEMKMNWLCVARVLASQLLLIASEWVCESSID